MCNAVCLVFGQFIWGRIGKILFSNSAPLSASPETVSSSTYFNYSLRVPGQTLGKLFLIFSEAGNVDLISLLAATGIN